MTGQRPRVAFAVNDAFLELDDGWPLLQDALTAEGLTPSALVWDDPSADWSGADLIVATYMWGYVTRRREFVNWAYNVATGARLVNPAPVLEWGSDKTYLVDVAAEEVPIVPTIWVRAGDRWRPPSGDYVIKPSVASGGMGAARYVNHGFEVADRHVRQLLAAGQTVLIQPYQPTVDEAGETALIFFGGNYSHAVRKEALLRSDVGVIDRLWERQIITPAVPRDDQSLVANAAMRAVERRVGPTSYARVDLVDDVQGRPVVLEVEVVEPSLFLTHGPEAAARFAAHLRRLQG
jgi:glutathione synthase/RimK-type ligase-like ATP-grasp enzyme